MYYTHLLPQLLVVVYLVTLSSLANSKWPRWEQNCNSCWFIQTFNSFSFSFSFIKRKTVAPALIECTILQIFNLIIAVSSACKCARSCVCVCAMTPHRAMEENSVFPNRNSSTTDTELSMWCKENISKFCRRDDTQTTQFLMNWICSMYNNQLTQSRNGSVLLFRTFVRPLLQIVMINRVVARYVYGV